MFTGNNCCAARQYSRALQLKKHQLKEEIIMVRGSCIRERESWGSTYSRKDGSK